MPSAVEVQRGEGWGLIRLRAPGGLNKLGWDTLRPLHEAAYRLLQGGCRCLAVTGGGKSFAVGADLREVGRFTPARARDFSDLGNGLFRMLEGAEAVVVAGVDGFCLGGGLDLALAADWRMAASGSVFGHPGADLGLITGFGGTQRLPRLVGRSRAARWLFGAERLGAEEAYRAGLVQEVCPPGEFEERLLERVRGFASLSPRRIRDVKGAFRMCADGFKGAGGGF